MLFSALLSLLCFLNCLSCSLFRFRTLSCLVSPGVDNLLCVNSRAITVAGVNRHEFHPSRGRSVSLDTMREDARIMKTLNFNAARCSHYPQHRLWMEICDEAGLYVVDEANIETHGFQVIRCREIRIKAVQ